VEKCREAGIRVVMVTGDHPATALYIARQLGIGEDVITGWELEKIDVKDAIKKYNVFARVSPEQKLEIVKAFQEFGEVVAVTGDGINDAPALKRADVGVAMGSGSDAAKEAADIVLLDDSFSTIVDAVEEGRNVFRKIQRIIAWTLPTNGGEGFIVLSAFLLALQLPVLPVQILWINTVTAVLLGITLVFEPMEGNLLKLKPTKSELINRTIGVRILYVSILIVLIAYAALWLGGKERAVAVNAIIACEAWYLLTAHIDKSIKETGFRNKALLLGIILIAALQITVTNTAFGTILKLQPLSAFEWLMVVLVSLAVFISVEVEKALRGYREKIEKISQK
jgi:magnesium-transporting ATPase (P-type)